MTVTTGRTWEKFFQDNGQQANIGSKDFVLGLRILGTSPAPETGSNFVIAYNRINLFEKVTVTAAQLRACGTTPITILVAPGSAKFHSINKLSCSKKAGAVAFDFADYLAFGSAGGDSQFIIDNAVFNVAGNLNFDLIKQGQLQVANVAYRLSLIGGAASDASVGDSDMDIYIYYSIEDVKV